VPLGGLVGSTTFSTILVTSFSTCSLTTTVSLTTFSFSTIFSTGFSTICVTVTILGAQAAITVLAAATPERRSKSRRVKRLDHMMFFLLGT